jgi:hypothetical protein
MLREQNIRFRIGRSVKYLIAAEPDVLGLIVSA